ncbi:FecR family protein [Psychroserpens sp. AS72]|uniref:FecR family protein n=1 Tax=Psychroserpens sp. AS72 TaxID=3135775 RepID=UPI00316B403B
MSKEDQIKKWLNNELSAAEMDTFEQGEDFALYKAIVRSGKQFKASNFSKPESFNEFKTAYQNKSSRSKRIKWLKPVLRIASVIVIALGVYFTMFYDTLSQVQTLATQHTTVELPDASKVTLNAGSIINYSKKDWENNRSLNLNGEAYFEVSKGETFDVITSQGIVTVVGTAFNVKQRDHYFEVQCFEGIVSVTSGSHTKQLLAGDTFRILEDSFSVDKTTSSKPEWTSNKSTFKALPYKAVLAEVERQYDIKIRLSNVNEDRLFTGGFMHDNIENALISITQPMGLTYKINASNDVVIYGNKK